MEDKETIVTGQQPEAAEQPATQQPQGKTFTQEEFDRAVARRLRRQEAQIRGEYEPLVNVLKVGTGKEDLGEITEGLTEFYRSKGYDLQQRRTAPEYTDKDVKVLAKNDADEIIRDGDDAVAFEVDRLAKLGADNMTDRDKELYRVLGKHRQEAERGQKLGAMGVSEDVWKSEEFRSFAGQFAKETPIEKVYEIYKKTQPTQEPFTTGSMRTGPAGDTGLKDFYSLAEAKKFTKEDFDKNPKLYDAVQKSMRKWK